ncbi:MAG: hypothetical protein Q9M50_00125 [Methylococcales bacterium]|nr:hypothetical protein [Methylococcales bacterium]
MTSIDIIRDIQIGSLKDNYDFHDDAYFNIENFSGEISVDFESVPDGTFGGNFELHEFIEYIANNYSKNENIKS